LDAEPSSELVNVLPQQLNEIIDRLLSDKDQVYKNIRGYDANKPPSGFLTIGHCNPWVDDLKLDNASR
jgi:hypothetical protein